MSLAQNVPVCPGAPAQRSAETTRECRISLVTPLFDGVVHAGRPDGSMPIRGTAVRGDITGVQPDDPFLFARRSDGALGRSARAT